MSREIRRVPLDFDFPLGQTWSGYLTDAFDFPPCPDCTYEALPTLMDRLFPSPRHGSGYTPEAYAVSQTFYPHMIGGPMAERLAWHNKLGQAEVDNLVEHKRLDVWRDGRWHQEPRTAADVNAERHAHDSINRSILVEFRCQQLGITLKCPTCDGAGDVATAEQRQAAEEWEGEGPPTGDGYQLWQTVSEGGPVSPVFATPQELADWIRTEGSDLDGRHTDRDALIRWIAAEGSSVGSFVMTPERGLVSGVEMAAGGDS